LDARRPAVVAAAGVTMYLTRAAVLATMRRVMGLAPGSVLVMSFILPLEMAAPDERAGYEASIKGARASGTPFLGFYAPADMLALAREAGFRQAEHVSAAQLAERYFAGRTDGLRPGSEALLVATV
jgi:O-methyltransferase involved in polyketide biosynthesis